jgi:hypothetical protein
MYIGRSAETPPTGWQLHSFADEWVAATLDTDPHGPRIFRPTTVRFEPVELSQLRGSHRRFQTDPKGECSESGRFWALWTLQDDGTLRPRHLPAPGRTTK